MHFTVRTSGLGDTPVTLADLSLPFSLDTPQDLEFFIDHSQPTVRLGLRVGGHLGPWTFLDTGDPSPNEQPMANVLNGAGDSQSNSTPLVLGSMSNRFGGGVLESSENFRGTMGRVTFADTIPEPTSLLLVVSGSVALMAGRRR